eukprot:gene38627-47704_t
MKDVITNTTTRPGWYAANSSDLYLPSVSMDAHNTYSATGVVGSTNYSGVIIP